MSGQGSSALRRLADEMGILPGYVDQTGRHHRETSDESRVALLAAMGVDASTESLAAAALEEMRAESRARMLPHVRVIDHDEQHQVTINAPEGWTAGTWQLSLTTENGSCSSIDGRWDSRERIDIALPSTPPPGYHTLAVALSQGARETRDEQTLIIVPRRCVTPADLVGDARLFGITANLYTVRSRTNWGVGDLTDLGSLLEWTADIGGDFVGVSPLHALINRGIHVSPYGPVSRLFRNALYLDVSAIPEAAASPQLGDRLSSAEFQAELAALRESSAVRYEQVMAVKGLALDGLHRAFRERARDDQRVRAYDAYVAANRAALDRYATWMAISELHGSDWRAWPSDLQDPAGDEVHSFATAHAERVEYHRWLQFEIDRQLQCAAETGRSRGMRLGIYTDLAVGSSPSGADCWAYRDLFVRGASIGAPPDSYAPNGQNWGLPPISPRALERDRYQYFIQLIRSGFRHAGALRIDHVMGLFRLFWIPDGKGGDEGAYVRYPAHDLLGILALESARNNALVVGEDLGTVPAEVPAALEQRGILSSKVLIFERESTGEFRSADKYPPLALATADTHDMPPIIGIWDERDIDLRASLGVIPDADGVRRAREERAREREQLLARLAQDGVLPSARSPLSLGELRAAIHAYLCRTPSQLVGLALDDVAGESEPVNVPGVPQDRYPSWSRKMRLSIDEIRASDDARLALRCDGRARVSHPPLDEVAQK